MTKIYTIGFSNQSQERLINTLKRYNITHIIDVRSTPRSKYTPQFNQDVIKESLADNGIQYIYEGDKLGGRPRPQNQYNQAANKQEFLQSKGFNSYQDYSRAFYSCIYPNGIVNYNAWERSRTFKTGISEVLNLANNDNNHIVIACTEKWPEKCHRTVEIAKVLQQHGCEVKHIMPDGTTYSHDVIENTIKHINHTDSAEEAYAKQNLKIGWKLG